MTATIALLILSFVFSVATYALEYQRVDTLVVLVNFRQSKIDLDPEYMNNRRALAEFVDAYRALDCDSPAIRVSGYASPEGPVRFNRWLSRKRTEVLCNYLMSEFGIPAENIRRQSPGEDWEGLYRAVMVDKNVPQREAVIEILENTPEVLYDKRGRVIGGRKQSLKQLNGGASWRYLLQNIYPHLRGTNAEIICLVTITEPDPEPVCPPEPEVVESVVETVEPFPDSITPSVIEPMRRPFYMSLHTNMLYDVAAIPNLGAEFYLGKQLSIAGNWHYAWWDNDSRHRWWRTYGGYLAGRYWFGSRAKEKPLTGHHAGIYGQILLYDFEWGGTGYLSGAPGRNIGYKPTWALGVEYGFALPLTSRLNIDFTLGIGYLQGQYLKYKPLDGHYVWQSTHMRHWFGPTKLEVSLVWLLGYGNVNQKKKGGAK